jgi:hypothetical protein
MKNVLIFLSLLFFFGCSGDDSSTPTTGEIPKSRPAELVEIDSLIDLVKFEGRSWSFTSSFKEENCWGSATMEVLGLEDGLLISYEVRGTAGPCATKTLKGQFRTKDTLVLSFLENADEATYSEKDGRKFLTFKEELGGKVEEIKIYYSTAIEYPILADVTNVSYATYSTINIFPLSKEIPSLEGVKIYRLYFEDAIDLFQSYILDFKESL